MDRWQNRVAVVTAAASGIGAAVVRDLLKNNMVVVGLDISLDRMEKMKSSLQANLQSRFNPMKCDLTMEKEIMHCFQLIEKNLGSVDILVNNVGICKLGQNLATMDTKMIKDILDLNVMTAVICNREAIRIMKAHNIDGHIIFMNGVLGHHVTMINNMSANIYSPTKHCITAMAEVLRRELILMGSKIRVTSLSPGLVNTEMLSDAIKTTKTPVLRPEDISDALLYIIGTPANVQITELMIRAVGETILD